MNRLKILFILLISVLAYSNSLSQGNDIAKLKQNLTNDAINDFGFKPRTERYTPFEFEKAEEYAEKSITIPIAEFTN